MQQLQLSAEYANLMANHIDKEYNLRREASELEEQLRRKASRYSVLLWITIILLAIVAAGICFIYTL